MSATTLIIRSGEFMNFTAIKSHAITRLAQSVEHGTLNPRVVGSSPTLGELIFGAALAFSRSK